MSERKTFCTYKERGWDLHLDTKQSPRRTRATDVLTGHGTDVTSVVTTAPVVLRPNACRTTAPVRSRTKTIRENSDFYHDGHHKHSSRIYHVLSKAKPSGVPSENVDPVNVLHLPSRDLGTLVTLLLEKEPSESTLIKF